jgi:RNA recognition motif-containing protein
VLPSTPSSVRFVGFVLASQVPCRLLEIQLSESPWASETAVPSEYTQEKSKMSKRLFIGNLSFDTNELELRDLFTQNGTVVDLKVVTDRETGRSRGFAFVEMSSQDEATNAISELNGREFGGRTIKVNEAEERGARSGSGSGSGSRRW